VIVDAMAISPLFDQVWPLALFDATCQACPRLAQFHVHNRERFPDYGNAPVPPFGQADAALLIVGLAPGLHGANRTRRPFTGDYCGDLLYQTLYEFGFASKPQSVAVGDGLVLHNARVSNAVKCVPPENKPTPTEIRCCNGFLQQELVLYPPQVILALGVVAHQAVVKALGQKLSVFQFAHGAQHCMGGMQVFNSYHVSRYNTQTGRLTPAMFAQVVSSIRQHLGPA
jgi:uracil-DNA glycosylase family 4